jgi:hypothetical protein
MGITYSGRKAKMIPIEKIELEVYRFLKPRLDQRVYTTIGELVNQVNGQWPAVQEALVSLDDRKLIRLSKHITGDTSRVTFASWVKMLPPNEFFGTHEGFDIELGPQGRRYFEILEERRKAEVQEPLIFISCGQYREYEKDLGRALKAAADNAGYQGYFAENENTLQNLTTNIFGKLFQCAAFVGVMHHRGEFADAEGRKHIRGSVWVEQEVAIAAFLADVLKRKIEVLMYLHRGISFEGVRVQLRLDPVEFDTEDQVLSDFKARLESGKFKLPAKV